MIYECTTLGCVCVFPGVFLSSRVTGACPVTTDLIMRVNVRTTTTTTTTTTHCTVLLRSVRVLLRSYVQLVLHAFHLLLNCGVKLLAFGGFQGRRESFRGHILRRTLATYILISTHTGLLTHLGVDLHDDSRSSDVQKHAAGQPSSH